VKPFRGKRRGPQSLFVGFSLSARWLVRRRIRKGRDGRLSLAGRRVHFRRAERHDRFVGSQKPSGEGGRFAQAIRCYRPGRRWPARRTEEDCIARSVAATVVSVRPFELRGLSSVPASRERTVVMDVRGRLGVGGESVGYLSDPS
jgi:hypothetical protein